LINRLTPVGLSNKFIIKNPHLSKSGENPSINTTDTIDN